MIGMFWWIWDDGDSGIVAVVGSCSGDEDGIVGVGMEELLGQEMWVELVGQWVEVLVWLGRRVQQGLGLEML